ncbi:MAG: alpha/beta hydrolase [Candidatus Eisenbacteria bacterium]|uniref:Alpha/beta hydrolase n=1 Tax=Eiseniibacteriota bacterium TaxID=2212470 RepID=A0A9D6QMZ6_UNCEI|nr:alpha/beta hydrolase [Candidatus Eisenbacteria bacterium]MBI3540263.1 alpha/beta hydrolase [Candidatus Eisenbacteria bacterium]
MKRLMKICAVTALAAGLGATGLRADGPVALKTTEFGHGPTIVMLHGLGSARMVWLPTAKKLLATHHIVMVDLPGHGDSALPDPFSLDACAAALDQVLATQNPDSTVLVAVGFGSIVAITEAQAHPEHMRGLAVIDGSTRSPMKVPEQQQMFFQMMDTRYDDILRSMAQGQGRDSVERAELLATAQAVSPVTMKTYMRAAVNVDVSAAVKTMKPSFLFIGSDRRWPADKDWPTLAKELGYEDAGPITARRVADAGALMMKEQPDTLAAILADFTAKAITKK